RDCHRSLADLYWWSRFLPAHETYVPAIVGGVSHEPYLDRFGARSGAPLVPRGLARRRVTPRPAGHRWRGESHRPPRLSTGRRVQQRVFAAVHVRHGGLAAWDRQDRAILVCVSHVARHELLPRRSAAGNENRALRPSQADLAAHGDGAEAARAGAL